MKTKSYKTYAALSAAFKSGELDKHYYLMLDKGAQENCLCYHNPDLTDEENDLKQEQASAMWPQDPPIEGLFEAAGIRCEWC
jgi:23S rRNA-/tRNA-specific pseudouridylate synthase